MPTGVYPRKPAIERFMSFVDKTAEGHWLWVGGINPETGYGAFWADGKYVSSHVFSYTTFVGPIPAGHQIRHKCDIHACVNPEDLETGTAKDNAADRESRNRHPHLPTGNKLTDEQVAKLRREYGLRHKFDKPTLAEIGQEYGIAASSVCWLLKGHTYRKVVMPT